MESNEHRTLPSFRDCMPTEEGGSIARGGFAYQDHIAAHFCLCLLSSTSLREVWCETYDDIVLISNVDDECVIEFVQVKADKLGQLWSIAKLCGREAGKVGSSIMERSLNRSAYVEDSVFRMITMQNLNCELEVLKLDRDHELRAGSNQLNLVEFEISKKLNHIVSPAGYTVKDWVKSTVWETFGQAEVINANKLSLIRQLETMGIFVTTDMVDSIYEALIARLKWMAELRNIDLKSKVMTRQALIDLLRDAQDPFPGYSPSAKLEAKLQAAHCDPICINQAEELRRAYRNAKMKRPYLNLGRNDDDTEIAILGRLHKLLSRYDSGKIITTSDRAFHTLCVDEIEGLAAKADVGAEQLSGHDALGCMYEITSRCRHRFTKAPL